MVAKISERFFEPNETIGRVNAKKQEPRMMCVIDILSREVDLTPVSEEKLHWKKELNLHDSAKILNLYIKYVADTHIPLKDQQLVNLYENLAKLNEKIDAWNKKVKKSKGVVVGEIFGRIFSLCCWSYKKSLLAKPLNIESIHEQYKLAKVRSTQSYYAKFSEYMASATDMIAKLGIKAARAWAINQVAMFFGVPPFAINAAVFAYEYFSR